MLSNPGVSNRQGVVILFAVLLVSIVLTISLTLLNITYKQLVLSAIARESQYAFFASDSALECARHWNSFNEVLNLGETCSPFGCIDRTGPPSVRPPAVGNTFECAEDIITLAAENINISGDTYATNFKLDFTQFTDKKTCGLVTVTKEVVRFPRGDPNGEPVGFLSRIESLGYNQAQASGDECPQYSDRTVERGTRR